MTHPQKKKIYFIIGPTSSGKTTASIELAKKLMNSEIISADSRQVYRDLNLSTGKITTEEMEEIPHHLLDVVNPSEYFSVVDFTNLVVKKIEEIFERCNIPIICGGTGFYIDSLLYKYNLPPIPNNPQLREELNSKSLIELREILEQLPRLASQITPSNEGEIPSTTEFYNNKHRLIRTIEIIKTLGYFPELVKEKRFSEKEYDVEIIKINIPRNILREKIYKRLLERIESGMIEEIKSVKEKYNLNFKYLEKLGLEFKWVSKYLQDQISKEEMIQKLFFEICQYAKRQDTWFRRY